MPATTPLTSTLEPLRLRYLDSSLPAWLRAAGDALFSLLPAGVRRQVGARNRRLLLRLEPGALQLRALSDQQSTLIGSVPTDDPMLLSALRAKLDESAASVPRWLLLDAGQALRPILTVPASAESRLREMMLHEIDRQTPFTADQVSFEPRVLARDAVSRQLRVELVVLPLQRLSAALERLGPMAEGLAGIDVVDEVGNGFGVNLLPRAGRTARSDSARRANRWLALISVLALLGSMWMALGNRQAALDRQAASLAAATADAREVRKLRNELEGSARAANFLDRKRAGQPTILELLADLTQRIPDSTWLEKIAINGGNVVLLGQSEQASSLVALLQASPLVHKPTLTGSVQRDARSGKERFTLTAVVAGSDADRESDDASSRSR